MPQVSPLIEMGKQNKRQQLERHNNKPRLISSKKKRGKMTDKAQSRISEDGIHSAFFYGTLMVPEVFYSVCYGTKSVPPAIAALHTFRPAVLHGYCRRRVLHADYPGIVADEGHSVLGTLATGLTRANMAKLDFFEGSQYERRRVCVSLLADHDNVDNVIIRGNDRVEEGNEEVDAEVYVFLARDELEEKEWDLDEFRREKLTKWTRAGYVFEDCDPEQPAKVVT
ncbi:AIG2-like family-domain-containing protein [Apodospora peruviana]|uniref:Putative gamma-glutamylcyclotransferase n=1 Tax=Apodospora peruviana TaxID=516989 RepID=A0AAE0IJJ5_9PEZI|nr:AIG2-like family-domain-containing protein [Apodospora peruviana]